LATKELELVSPHRIVSHFVFFHRLKKKLKGHHFDTTEVIEVESQVVLNSLTEFYFHDAF
jgi:hypothetical protein